MNLETLSWDKEILDEFGIPQAMLPEIRSSSENYGLAKEQAVKNVAIAGILGDQQAALVGQTCFEPGEAKNTYGTDCFLLMNTGTRKLIPAPVCSQPSGTSSATRRRTTLWKVVSQLRELWCSGSR